MARRIPDPDGGGILMGCSVCGRAFSYPQDGCHRSDGSFRCFESCNDPLTDQEYYQQIADSQSTRVEESVPDMPMGPMPNEWS